MSIITCSAHNFTGVNCASCPYCDEGRILRETARICAMEHGETCEGDRCEIHGDGLTSSAWRGYQRTRYLVAIVGLLAFLALVAVAVTR